MPVICATDNPMITQREISHTAFSRAAAGECMVLLENDGTLPVSAPGKLALYGNGARRTVRGGTGSGDVNARSSVSIEQGLKNAGFIITTEAWLDRQDEIARAAEQDYQSRIYSITREEGISEQHAMFIHPLPAAAPAAITAEDMESSDTDTAVYVISRISGEGADRRFCRGDYLLYEEEKEQLEQLGRLYARLILVLNVGGVMDLSEVKEISGINSVLLMTQLGSAGGDALADVLTGKVNPSGKLTDTWAKRYEDYPSSASFGSNDGNADDEYYTEGIYVGYRYFDTFCVEPLYPFGYGMSYTDFEIKFEDIETEGESVRLSVSVKNTGDVPGREVVQVYVSAPAGTIPKPSQELVCFQKTKLLASGEKERMELTFFVRDMASYCETRSAWVLEAGAYELRLGGSSAHACPAAVLTLDKTVVTEELKYVFEDRDPVHERKAPDGEGKNGICETILPETARRMNRSLRQVALRGDEILTKKAGCQERRREFATDKKDILTVKDIRDGRCTAEELAAQLTVREMAELCVGTLRMDGGHVVGNASAVVPGAAGDTSGVIAQSRGVRSLIMADGPAGLRLQPEFHTGGHTYYQYCTSLPIGWALAQSWNCALLEEAGSMIGAEMELFGIDLWLAPAMNIHRNPLGGRNFEYYSEDPLVTGKTAAAIIKGVQKHKGKGAVIKHFAANSQEDNRYFSNSHVSGRALREIYLKGFEIAVKESRPAAVMTSYNLLNGIHTANHRGLLQEVLRNEWGFQGLVMSDWFTSQDQTVMIGSVKTAYPISASTGCIYAGNDVQMPGCQKNVDDMIEAVEKGVKIDGYYVTLADLQRCAAAVIRTVASLS